MIVFLYFLSQFAGKPAMRRYPTETLTGCGELFDRAFLAVADAIAPHRSHRVVIGRLRL
jgi:hypothetical protein